MAEVELRVLLIVTSTVAFTGMFDCSILTDRAGAAAESESALQHGVLEDGLRVTPLHLRKVAVWVEAQEPRDLVHDDDPMVPLPTEEHDTADCEVEHLLPV